MSKIEQKFYESFDIEAIELDYLEITDHKLLELLVLADKTGETLDFSNIDSIKDSILQALINYKDIEWIYYPVKKIMETEDE